MAPLEVGKNELIFPDPAAAQDGPVHNLDMEGENQDEGIHELEPDTEEESDGEVEQSQVTVEEFAGGVILRSLLELGSVRVSTHESPASPVPLESVSEVHRDDSENGEEDEADAEYESSSDKENCESVNFKTPKKRCAAGRLEAPLKRKYRSPRLLRADCPCDILRIENKKNKHEGTDFDGQREHMEFQKKRLCLKMDDVALGSEFIVGKEINIKLCMLHEYDESVKSNVVLVIFAGLNEIRFGAMNFLDYVEPKITELIIFCDENMQKHKFDKKTNMTLEYYTDEVCDWICMKQYIMTHVSEQISISAITWAELRTLLPVLRGVTDYYTNRVLMHKTHFATSDSGTPIRKKIDTAATTSETEEY